MSLPSRLLPLSIHPSLSLSFCPRAGDREITAQLDTNVTPAAKRKEPLCRRKLPNVARKFAMLCTKHSKAPYQKLKPLDRARIGIQSRGSLCVDSDETNWCYCDDRGRRRTGWRRQKMDAPRLSGCERALVRGNQGDRAQRAAHATKHAQPEFEVWAIISGCRKMSARLSQCEWAEEGEGAERFYPILFSLQTQGTKANQPLPCHALPPRRTGDNALAGTDRDQSAWPKHWA